MEFGLPRCSVYYGCVLYGESQSVICYAAKHTRPPHYRLGGGRLPALAAPLTC